MRSDKEIVSAPFNFDINLVVRFNKLVSDKLDLALMRADNEAVSVPLNFVENLVVRLKTEVSVVDAYKA